MLICLPGARADQRADERLHLPVAPSVHKGDDALLSTDGAERATDDRVRDVP